VLAIDEIDGYWAIDPSVGSVQYLAPVVRLVVRNKGETPHRSVEFTANFRQKGQTQIWSSAWQRVTPPGGKDFKPGEKAIIGLKPEGEGRYTSTGPVESFFQNAQFKDVRAEVWGRVGASPWVKLAEQDIERRIGSHAVQTPPH
jgi:hypothetical protein